MTWFAYSRKILDNCKPSPGSYFAQLFKCLLKNESPLYVYCEVRFKLWSTAEIKFRDLADACYPSKRGHWAPHWILLLGGSHFWWEFSKVWNKMGRCQRLHFSYTRALKVVVVIIPDQLCWELGLFMIAPTRQFLMCIHEVDGLSKMNSLHSYILSSFLGTLKLP